MFNVIKINSPSAEGSSQAIGIKSANGASTLDNNIEFILIELFSVLSHTPSGFMFLVLVGGLLSGIAH